ncbi:O-antigen ligase family protein [Methylomonas sp. MED-D]|uniref:O-antigen ligase family protein n=1 Tax=unclassified Methylomonas TaxID=2608980 RepID=UPI0028A4EFDC|nr:O-antigen ligase family protein [Methylomonas sp. MV1]MDT4330074.1 O-antigen ligase family protein [Methylomonas sp. MV1]
MIEIAIFFVVAVFLFLMPTAIPYLALLYLFINGLASREFVGSLKFTLGSVNILPLDLLYAVSVVFMMIFFVKKFFLKTAVYRDSAEANVVIFLIVLYFLFYMGKLVNGFLSNVPLDSLVRMFMSDTQQVYFFLPLAIYSIGSQFKRLTVVVIVLSICFPLYQPFLYGSKDTMTALRGQDTLRLGFGDGNVLLGLGAIALFCWEYKKYLTFLPLSGILMLGHRSAFISIALAFSALSFFKGNKIKNLVLIGLSGVLMLAALTAMQSFANINMLDKLISRVEQTFEPTKTTMVRAAVITTVIEEVDKRPFTGLEYRELKEIIKRAEFSPRDFNIYHPHNFIYLFLMGGGFLGSALLFLVIGRSMTAAYVLAKTDEFKLHGSYLFSSILYFLIFSLMNTTMTTVGYALWFLCGCVFWFFNKYKATGIE